MNKFILSVVWIFGGLAGGWVINEVIYFSLNRQLIGVNLMAAFLPAAGAAIFSIFCIVKAILIFKGEAPSPLVPNKYKEPMINILSIYSCLYVVTKLYIMVKY